jgi:hypothetical protein
VSAFYNTGQQESSAGAQFPMEPDRLSGVLCRIIATVLAAINFQNSAEITSQRKHICVSAGIGAAALAYLLFLSLLSLLKSTEDYSHGAHLFFQLVAVILTIAVVRATQHKLSIAIKIGARRFVFVDREAIVVE